MGLTLQTNLPAQTAGAGDTITTLGVISDVGGTDNTIVRAEVVAPAGSTVTGAATNNATISVRQLRAGSVIATPATITLGNGVNLNPETPVALTVTATALKEGDVLDVLCHQNAAGLALPVNLRVEVEDNFTNR